MSSAKRPRPPWRVVVTCEHASHRVPAELDRLGLRAAVLASHRGFDPGALTVARSIAKLLAAPLHQGRWSRLVADLNRSSSFPGVIARRVDGRLVPGNQLTELQHTERLRRYWQPYRDLVERDVRALCQRGPVLHLSVHSFVERLHGVERRNDIGLLHDPRRPREREFCERLRRPLAAVGLSVRRNFPYFGHTDGMTTHLRGCLPAPRYVGIEIECNQRLSRTSAGQRRLARALCQALAAAVSPE
ncbi:MAG: N-formylglutamate amidohydrolase [Planctomycetota bacterium]